MSIQARYAQALKLQSTGQSEAALAVLSGIVLERPQTAEAHFQIGRIHAAAGRLDKARAALLSALQHRPGEVSIQDALTQVVPFADHAALREAMAERMPPAPRLAYAERLRRDGRYWGAEGILRAAVSARDETAVLPLARLLAETCRVDEAEALLRKAKPKTAEIWYEIALLRARLRRVAPAREAMSKAVKGGAHPVQAAVALSTTLSRENEPDGADAVLGSAIKAHPTAGMLYGQRGQIAQSRGKLDAAQVDLRKAIALDPRDGEAYRAYFAAAKVAPDEPLVDQCAAQLRDRSLPEEAAMRMQYAMAKARGDQGQHAAVFAHLDAANGLQKKAYPFDFDQAVDGVRANLRAARALAGQAPVGPPDPVLFVAGLPRSGTTLIESVLAAHPQVSAGGELPFLVDALKPLSDRIAEARTLTPEDFADPAQRYLQAARRRLGRPAAFTDKSVATPYRIGLAAIALPGARFILPRRDPRDVGLSIYRNMFAGGTQRYSTDLYEIGRMIRLHDAAVAAWSALVADRIHVVDYDALTAEPEPQIRALVAAAGLPWDEACLAPHRAERRVDTLSFAQVRQPIYRSSVAGWRRFEAELGPLEDGLAQAVTLD